MIIRDFKKGLNNYRKRNYEFRYYKQRKKRLFHNTVLLESTHGSSFDGHVYYLAKEIRKLYPSFKLVIALASNVPKSKYNDLMDENTSIVEFLSKEYAMYLARSEYLINDTTFYSFFNKRDEQKYFIIWHGTPLKHMGKHTEDPLSIANVQRNFFMADKIVVSNQYSLHIMSTAYNLEGIYNGKFIIAGSPRNSILFSSDSRMRIRNKYNMENKKVILYMPTWRGTINKVSNDDEEFISYLKEIDKAIDTKKNKFFIKLHPFQQSIIDKISLKNIEVFPNDTELYEFLTAVDTLITDYSSILFDFMNTKRQIILFAYDKDEYYNTRGAYRDISEFPFPIATNAKELIQVLSNNNANDYSEMMSEFCSHDSSEASKIVVRNMFEDLEDHVDSVSVRNTLPTVFLMSGALWDNGITTALLNTLNAIDTTKRNYVIFFNKHQMKKEHQYKLNLLPKNVLFYPVTGLMPGSVFEKALKIMYLKYESFKFPFLDRILKRMYKLEFKRIFGHVDIDWLISYTGFERQYAELISNNSGVNGLKTGLFVHTDMFYEYKVKKNFSMKIVKKAYNKANKIMLVHENLKKQMVTNIPSIESKIIIVDNFLGDKIVEKKSKENLVSSLLDVRIDYAYNEKSKQDALKFIGYSGKPLSEALKNTMYNISIKTNMEKLFPNLASNKDYLDESIVSMIKKEFSLPIFIDNDLKLSSLNSYSFELLGFTKLKILDNLLNKNHVNFINIGRYDLQKGHERLIKSFEKLHEDYPNTSLIIVAPHGPLKAETIRWVRETNCYDSIFLIGGMSNPYPLLKYCNAFVLSSYYEGLGLVAYEALAVKTDLITVNIPETVAYFEGNEALIVNNSEQGITDGLYNYMDGKHDFEDFNFKKRELISLNEFERIFNENK